MKGIKITKKNANNIRKNLIKENQIHRDYKINSDKEYNENCQKNYFNCSI